MVLGDIRCLYGIIDIGPLLETVIHSYRQTFLVEQSSANTKGKGQLKGIGNAVPGSIGNGVHVIKVRGDKTGIGA